jgi:hypothetical protein
MSEPIEFCDLIINASGSIRMIYNEMLDGFALGQVQVQRASHVEPDSDGYWHVDLGPVNGPRLGPFMHRSAALAIEREWLSLYWLENPTGLT